MHIVAPRIKDKHPNPSRNPVFCAEYPQYARLLWPFTLKEYAENCMWLGQSHKVRSLTTHIIKRVLLAYGLHSVISVTIVVVSNTQTTAIALILPRSNGNHQNTSDNHGDIYAKVGQTMLPINITHITIQILFTGRLLL